MRRADLNTPPIEQPAFRSYDAEVSSTDPVSVLIPAYSGDLEYPDVTWVSSGQPPIRGARCLATIDDQGNVWAFPADPSPIQVGAIVTWNGTPPDGWVPALSIDGVQFYRWEGVS